MTNPLATKLEPFTRVRERGLMKRTRCAVPLTQIEVRDAAGMTSVHVNRTRREFKARGLAELKSRVLTIPSLTALQKVALFEPGTLHMGRPDAEFDADDV